MRLAEYLRTETNETHTVTVQDMIEYLERYDITAERKSIYDDIRELEKMGYEVVHEHGQYFLGQREFQLSEVELLLYAVQSSRFITEKKTRELINKLMQLTNRHDAEKLRRMIHLPVGLKSMEEKVYYTVDHIAEAINTDKQVRFRYYNYKLTNENASLRRNGKVYEVSPFTMIWDNDNCYLMAYDAASGELHNYRMDKILGVEISDEPRLGKEAFEKVDLDNYKMRVFNMYTGPQERVRIRFAESLLGPVTDRFGKRLAFTRNGEGSFLVNVDVDVSPQFFAWLYGFGTDAEIIGPEKVRKDMADYCRRVMDMYSK